MRFVEVRRINALRYNLQMEQTDILKTVRMDRATWEELQSFSEIEKRTTDEIIREALRRWFDERHRNLLEKNLTDENARTNLSYEEFWEGVDI